MGFREKIIFFGVIPWILVILITFFLVLPSFQGLFEKGSILKEKEDSLNSISSNIKTQKNVDKLKEKINSLQKELKGFNKQLPKEDELETFYVDLQKAVNKSNIYLLKMNISKESVVKFPKDFFENISVDDSKKSKKESKKKKRKSKTPDPLTINKRNFKLNIVGDYENILDLLYYLQNYYRYIGLEYIAIKEYTGNKIPNAFELYENPLDVTFTFNVYRHTKNIIPEASSKKKK